MGEAKNRKNEIEALKAMGRRVANLTTPSTTHRNVNGFIVGNPYDIMAENFRNADTIIYDKPYGWHWDVGIKFVPNRLEVAANTIGNVFKTVVEGFVRNCTNAKYELYIYVCKDDNRYVRFEVLTSHEYITDGLDAIGPRLSQLVMGRAA